MVCNCKKSKCETNQCGCRRVSNHCSIECGCVDCQNCDAVSNIYTDSSDSDKEDLIDINDLASIITEQVRVSVSKKKDDVFEYRGDKDIYTNTKRNFVESPQVDHIVEDQILGHATARVLMSQSYQPYLKELKSALNLDTLDNYNVTFGPINQSKGSIIKSYLKDGRNRGYSLRALVIDKYERGPFGKHMEPIFAAMNDTFPVVEEYIRNSRRSDGHVTGSRQFELISDELANMFNEMDLDIDAGRKTRSKKY